MVNYEKAVHKELLPGEIIDGVYKQSDSYIHENPLFSVLNWLLIISYFINAGIIIYLASIGFTQYEPYRTAIVGAIFFFVNLALYLYSISPAGNKIRKWKIPGFKYGYDYSHASLDDDSDNEVIYPRSIYTTYFAVANAIGAFNLHLISIGMPTVKSIYAEVFGVFGCCALVVIVNMLWREWHRKVAILTNLRVLLYDINTDKIDYIYLTDDIEAYKRPDSYTIAITNPKLVSMMTFGEAFMDEYRIGSNCEHAYMRICGLKKCEELYKKVKQ